MDRAHRNGQHGHETGKDCQLVPEIATLDALEESEAAIPRADNVVGYVCQKNPTVLATRRLGAPQRPQKERKLLLRVHLRRFAQQ